MTTTPYELLARFATNGTIAGVSIRYLTTVDGKVYEGDPQPLSGVDDPVFNEFADQFSASVVAERDELASQVTALNNRISELLTETPYNPRVIEASAFINRTTPGEMLQLFGSQDPNVQQIAAMLLAYKANDWRIELDSVDMQQSVGYLQLVGLVSSERAAALLRDGTRAESYVNDGST
jgi:hypothetical protein